MQSVCYISQSYFPKIWASVFICLFLVSSVLVVLRYNIRKGRKAKIYILSRSVQPIQQVYSKEDVNPKMVYYLVRYTNNIKHADDIVFDSRDTAKLQDLLGKIGNKKKKTINRQL